MGYSTCIGGGRRGYHAEARTCDRCDGCESCGDVGGLRWRRLKGNERAKLCGKCWLVLIAQGYATPRRNELMHTPSQVRLLPD